jgi:hypothetical protein
VADQPHPTTGTSLAGVPVVDLTGTVRGLLEHAEEVREQRAALLAWVDRYAASMGRRADYLENLASTLAGSR